jgi:alkylation response protein AidB-like acyl-CoA dehydrogenase
LLGLEAPRSMGGLGLDFVEKLQVLEQLSGSCMAFAFSLVNSHNVALRLLEGDAPRHREELVPQLLSGELFGGTALSEPGAGSDFAGIATAATRCDGGWLLNGSKGWITNAAIGSLFVVYAQTDARAGWRGIASFLVDTRDSGFERGELYDLVGGNAIGAGEFTLCDYFVADADVLELPGAAFKMAMAGVNGARTYVAAMVCGMLQSSLDQAVSYGVQRHSFGQPLLDHQGLRWQLADVAADLEALRAVTERAGRLIRNGDDAVLAAAVAKKIAGQCGVKNITVCMQAMGANGLRREHNLGRHLNCAKIAAYTDGSTEMMNERIGAYLRRRASAP